MSIHNPSNSHDTSLLNDLITVISDTGLQDTPEAAANVMSELLQLVINDNSKCLNPLLVRLNEAARNWRELSTMNNKRSGSNQSQAVLSVVSEA